MTPAYCRSCDHTHLVGTPCWFAGSGDGRAAGSPTQEESERKYIALQLDQISKALYQLAERIRQPPRPVIDAYSQARMDAAAAPSRREPSPLLEEFLESEAFDRVMYAYRCASSFDQAEVIRRFEDVQSAILRVASVASRREPSDLAAQLRALNRYRRTAANASDQREEFVRWSDVLALLAGADEKAERVFEAVAYCTRCGRADEPSDLAAKIRALISKWRIAAADQAETANREYYRGVGCTPEFLARIRVVAADQCQPANELAALLAGADATPKDDQ